MDTLSGETILGFDFYLPFIGVQLLKERILSLRNNSLLLRVDLDLKGLLCTGKQTGSHKVMSEKHGGVPTHLQ